MDKRNNANLVLYYEVYELKNNFTEKGPCLEKHFLFKSDDEKSFKIFLRNKLQKDELGYYTIFNTFISDECSLIVNICRVNY